MQAPFTKQVTIADTTYTIKVFTDIYEPVGISDQLVFGIYDAADVSILSDPSLINTNNFNVSSLVYTGVNQNLSIRLLEQSYNSVTGSYYNIPVSQNIKDTTRTYYQYSVLNGDLVSVSAVFIPNYSENGTAVSGSLLPNTTYTIEIDFNILLGISPAEVNVVRIEFITADATADPTLIKNFSTLCANSLFKLNNLDMLDDVRNYFINPNPFNYKFTPVKKNEDGTYSNETDVEENDVVLRFDTGKTLEDLYIKQYLSEYKEYFSLLDSELASDPNKSMNLLNETKISLFTKSNLLNSFAKGTLKGIETVLGFFCQNIGQFTFQVENSPLNSNFIYRITSDMPKVYWTSVIKDIVHPISWRDEYIQIDNGVSQLPTTSASYTSPTAIMYDAYSINTRDYYKKLVFIINGLSSRPRYYIDIDNESMYNGDTRFYELAMVEDMTTNRKFNFKPNEYEVTLAYNNTDLIDELSEPSNFAFKNRIDTVRQVIYFECDYTITGVALEYYYQIKHNNKVIQKLRSNVPWYRCQLPFSFAGEEITVMLTLTNDIFSTTVSQTVVLPSA